MTRRFAYLGGLGVVCALGGLAWGIFVWAGFAQDAPAAGVLRDLDLVYARAGDEALHLDLALPAHGEGPFPAVVCLHGGGWVSGSRKQMTQTIEALARRGYVAAAVDYRLAPKHRWPACFEDCQAAVRWLRANAGLYRLDPNHVGVVGLSAGGHLACLLGVTDNIKVQAVVSFAGPTDLTAEELWTKDVREKNLGPLFGGAPEAKREELRQASPLHQAPKAPAAFLLLHGAADAVVPAKQAEALAEKVRRAGGAARVVVWEGEGHTWAGANLTRSLDQMLTFLDETLRK
jgi:acetyl esterase/lipase